MCLENLFIHMSELNEQIQLHTFLLNKENIFYFPQERQNPCWETYNRFTDQHNFVWEGKLFKSLNQVLQDKKKMPDLQLPVQI